MWEAASRKRNPRQVEYRLCDKTAGIGPDSAMATRLESDGSAWIALITGAFKNTRIMAYAEVTELIPPCSWRALDAESQELLSQCYAKENGVHLPDQDFIGVSWTRLLKVPWK